MDDSLLDQVHLWTEIKLEIIRKYAAAYSSILSKQGSIRKHIYIDAFAGYGKHYSIDKEKTIPGSPREALCVEPPFSEYHFVELKSEKTDELNELKQTRPGRVFIHPGDCNEILLTDIFPLAKYSNYARALCLLDPYSMQLDWNVIQEAGKMGSIEIFINFPIHDINRNIKRKNRADISEKSINRMNKLWGDSSWEEVLFKKSNQQNLFTDEREIETQNNEIVASSFLRRIKSEAGFKYAPAPLAMKNSKNSTVYYLYFASPSDTGGKIVTQIFDKYRNA